MNKHDASRPAQYKYAILLCTDQKFLKYGALLVTRIKDLMPDLQADICVASTEYLDLPAMLAPLDVRCVVMDVAAQSADFPVTDAFPMEAYLRFFAAQALARDYDRILYLDCDIIADQPDLMDMFSLDLVADTPLGAVRDMAQFKKQNALLPEMATLGIPPFPYLNSGVLLIDTQRWVDQDILARIVQTVRTTPQALTCFDQSALNLTLKGSWTEMSHHWNWMMQPKLTGFLPWDKPSLIHFTGPEKPWLASSFWLPSGGAIFMIRTYMPILAQLRRTVTRVLCGENPALQSFGDMHGISCIS